MKIEIKFDKPINGYWDGGAKSGGVFEVEHFPPDGHTKFGCYGLNFFFSVKTGRSDKETISRAKRWIKKHCRVPFSFVD